MRAGELTMGVRGGWRGRDVVTVLVRVVAFNGFIVVAIGGMF